MLGEELFLPLPALNSLSLTYLTSSSASSFLPSLEADGVAAMFTCGLSSITFSSLSCFSGAGATGSIAMSVLPYPTRWID